MTNGSPQLQEYFDQQQNDTGEGSTLSDLSTSLTENLAIANAPDQQREESVPLTTSLIQGLQQSSNLDQERPRPIWEREKDIFHSRLVRGFFWFSQFVACCITVMFCVFYLFATPDNSFVFWATVAGSIGGWLAITALWCLSGIFFSRLYSVTGISTAEETETSIVPLGSL